MEKRESAGVGGDRRRRRCAVEEATTGRWAVGGGEGYQRRKPYGYASSLPGGCACLRLRPLDLELGVDLGCAWIWAVQWMGKKEGGGARSECAARRRLLHLRSRSAARGRPLRLDRCSVWEEDGCGGAGGMESRAPRQGRDGKE